MQRQPCFVRFVLSETAYAGIQCDQPIMRPLVSVVSPEFPKRGETCGALIGALMALGIARGRSSMPDNQSYTRAMDDAQTIIDAFKAGIEQHYQVSEPLRNTLCPSVQEKVFGRSFSFLDPADRTAFFDSGGYSPNGCPTVCAIAAASGARKILES